jgi:hypothetical protein
MSKRGLLAERVEDRGAVLTRQMQIKHHEAWLWSRAGAFPVNKGERLWTGAQDLERVRLALLLQCEAQEPDIGFIVFDQHNACWSGGLAHGLLVLLTSLLA